MALDQSVLARGAKRVPFEQIPVIDIGAMFGDDRAAMERVATEIDKACREIGFLYVSNHGVPEATIARAAGVRASMPPSPMPMTFIQGLMTDQGAASPGHSPPPPPGRCRRGGR